MMRLAVLIGACLLDALLGDPYTMPHIIRAIGSLVSLIERHTRQLFPKTDAGERIAGLVLVVLVTSASTGFVWLVLHLLYACNMVLGFLAELFVCYQMLAARQLAKEARHVYCALIEKGLDAGREAVSMIVGRDTDALDEAGVIRATVETVAENASDGFVAPLLFIAIGGPVAGVFYKAVNTMDSMVGYKNDQYRHYGTVAARLDDVCNWVPARVTGALMCLVAPLVRLDGRGAWRILVRDHAKHASPNAGYPEAACAGALGVQLLGPASYFGEIHDKPTVGDDLRPIKSEDVLRANRLLGATAVAALLLALALCWWAAP